MKRLLAAMTAALMMVALVSSTAMAAPKVKYLTFGSATVTEGPTGTFTIVSDGPDPVYTTSPEYGGVYLNTKNQAAKPLGSVSFAFTSSGDVAGGAPRISIPVDTNGDGIVEGYAFLDAAGCGASTGPNTTVSTRVSTALANCHVNFGADYANWAAFVAAFPLGRISPAGDLVDVAFIIADGTLGTYIVSNIDLR